MKPYTGQQADSRFADLVLGGHIRKVDGGWYWTEYHVAYAQSPMDASKNFVTLEDATVYFELRLAETRKAWGHDGNRFSETILSEEPESRRVRFQSIRKNGKPGTASGVLYMHKIKRS